MTKKYTSKKINKQVNLKDEQDESYYDVSFDLPIDEETNQHSSPDTVSDLKGSSDKEKPSKWTGFYDEFREKQDESFEKAKLEQVEFNEKTRQTHDEPSTSEASHAPVPEDFVQKDAAKSSIMLDRSIRKVRSLFADFDNYEAPKSNPYKPDVLEKLKHRERSFLNKGEFQSYQAKQESELPNDLEKNQYESETSSKWFKPFRHNLTDQTLDSIPPALSENLNEDKYESEQVVEVSETNIVNEKMDTMKLDSKEVHKTEDSEIKKMSEPKALNQNHQYSEFSENESASSFSEVNQQENTLSWYQRLNPFKAPNGQGVTQEKNTEEPVDSMPENLEAASSNILKKDDASQLPARFKEPVSNELVLDKDYFETQTELDAQTQSSNTSSSIKKVQEGNLTSHSIVQESVQTNQSFPAKNSSFSRRSYASDLPSPEEIRKERDRRRRLRVQELEQMTTSEEVEQTYKQSYTEWLKDLNKKTDKKDSTIVEKDKQLNVAPIVVSPNQVDEYLEENFPNEALTQMENSNEINNGGLDKTLTASEHNVLNPKETVDSDNFSNKLTPSNDFTQSFEIEAKDSSASNENNLSNQTISESTEIEEISLKEDIQNSDSLILDEQTIDDVSNLQIQEARIVPDLYQTERQSHLVLSDQVLPLADITDAMESESISTTKNLIVSSTESLINKVQTSSGDLSDEVELTDPLLIEMTHETSLLANDTVALRASNQVADVTESQVLDLTEVKLTAAETENTHFTVIHEPINAVEFDEQLSAEVEANILSEAIPIYKRKDKKIKKEIYSLATFSTKEKVLFGLNITFNVVKRIGLYIILIGILGGAMAAGTGFGYFANLVSKTPPPTQDEMSTAINRLEQQSTLYYASGDPIANIRADVVRTITSRDEVSPFIIDGLIATEDENFYDHPGVMPKAILRAVIESILTDEGSGGSTLTQQLVKQQLLSPDVTFFRKANEILLALRLENYFTKDQILMAYLNVSPFGRNNNGDNVAGIMKASQGIFGVEPSDVNLNQAAFLVGLPQDPYAYTPYDQMGTLVDDFQAGIDRMHEVLYRMYREEKITKEDYDSALSYDITKDFLPQETRNEQRQSYLYQAMMNGAIEQLMLMNIKEDGYDWKKIYEDVDWYNEYYFAAEEQLRTGGYKVYTTIDKEIYDHLQVSATTYDDQLGATYDGIFTDPETGAETYYIENVQTGIVVMDNKTGKVLGFVSGKDFENNQIDHAFNMRRSPGSTIKPLAVYGPAIEENLINPSTIIPDTEFVQTDSVGNEYRPTNYGGVVSGTFYSARTALMKSDNIPTVRIYEQLLNRKVSIIDYLEKMGFNTVDSYTETDTLFLPFALGGVSTGPTVFEQTRGFSTFANNGQYIDGYYIERIEDTFGNVVFQQNEPAVQVFSEDSNYLMVDMLRDTMDGGSGQTAGGVKNFGGDWIAKSGISEDSKDIWFIGSTPAITIGSWIGYDNQYAQHVFDLNDGFDREAVRSQTYWGNIVNDLYAFRPDIFGIDQTFTQPESVQTQTVLQTTGTLPGSVQINNRAYQVTSPTYEDLFKKSNPAQALSFNFMFNATDADHQNFWAQYAQTADQQRQQQQQQPASSSSSSSESEVSSGDETSESTPAEPTPEGTPPVEAPPAE